MDDIEKLQEGDVCVVSHTEAMTRSMPGIYMEVNRVDVLPQADSEDKRSFCRNPYRNKGSRNNKGRVILI